MITPQTQPQPGEAGIATARSAWSDPTDPDRAWPQRQADDPHYASTSNMGQTERAVSIAAGATAAIIAAQKPLSVRGLALGLLGTALVARGVSGRSAVYQSLGLSTRTRGENEPSADASQYYRRGIQVRVSQTICRPAADLYAFWRDFTRLPQFMAHLQRVEVRDAMHSHWVTSAPLGASVEWDAEIINDEPGKLIAWRSVGNPDVDNSGSVRFVESPELGATEVIVTIDYIPPAGKVGSWIAKLFGEEPKQQIREDLRRFKQLMETGEIASVEGQPHGQCLRQAV